jgi:hypothetical protein
MGAKQCSNCVNGGSDTIEYRKEKPFVRDPEGISIFLILTLLVTEMINELEISLRDIEKEYDVVEKILQKFERKCERKYPYFRNHPSMGIIIVISISL